ncbi:MAG: DEAD/DEAH box helicase family protein [Rhodospirillales bacterium]
MKLKFKVQPYQTNAVEAVVDCFAGQLMSGGVAYRMDPGRDVQQASVFEDGFKNADVRLTDTQVLQNIRDVQKAQNLPLSGELVSSAGCKFNLDVEMETGTGKTYCYIKTIFEMNKRYGWSKFIVMVPSIAIREGVYKSFQITPLIDTRQEGPGAYAARRHPFSQVGFGFFGFDHSVLERVLNFFALRVSLAVRREYTILVILSQKSNRSGSG